MNDFIIVPTSTIDHDWVRQFYIDHWGAEYVIAHGKVYAGDRLPGFYALKQNQRVGLVTYSLSPQGCEIVTLDSLFPGIGIGSALIEAVKPIARQSGCRRIWLVTTNDNLNALRFYQKRGFELVAVYRGAVNISRLTKPSIPLKGENGIIIRDEIELELLMV